MTERRATKERKVGPNPTRTRPRMGAESQFDHFMGMQRLAGNSAVVRLVSGSGASRPGSPGSRAARRAPVPVQRFPSTALTSPTKWSEYTAEVDRPGEGASGGIYILSSAEEEPELPKVVVKPVFGESAAQIKESGAQMTFGDRALNELFGINTPQSRSVAAGSSEFDELLELCQAKAPPKPQGEGHDAERWKPLSDAKSFVVMSKVPEATSLGSLVTKSKDDPKALEQLHTALFSKPFLTQLGKLCVADMLVGNEDRINTRAMNLGNVMVSNLNGGPDLWAIDTNTVLGEFNPEDIVKEGSASSNLIGTMSTKGQLTLGVAGMLDRIFEYVIMTMRKGTTKDESGLQMSPADSLQMSYEGSREELVSAFERGWSSGLSTIKNLAEGKSGRDKMKSLVGRAGGEQGGNENTRWLTLKLNAMYLGSRAGGGDHESAGGKAGGYAALKKLNEADPGAARVPDDGHSWNTAMPPGREVLGSSLRSVAALPEPNKITHIAMGKRNYNHDPAKYAQIMDAAQNAKDEVGELGKKQRGLLNKTSVTRNRTMAGRFVAETYELAAAGIRTAQGVENSNKSARLLEIAMRGRINPKLAPGALRHAEVLADYLPTLRRDLGEFSDGLKSASQGVSKMRNYVLHNELAKILASVASHLSSAESASRTGPAANPNLLVNVFQSASAP